MTPDASHLAPILDAPAAQAWKLEPPFPQERHAMLRDEAALLDALLARVPRGRASRITFDAGCARAMEPIARWSCGVAEREDDTARWDPIVKELLRIVGDLSRLIAAATGEPAVVMQIQETAIHALRAAGLVVPLSSYGRTREEPP